MRKIRFADGEYYHIYNRGVEKRDIVCDAHDVKRIFLSIRVFNTREPIGSIYEANFRTKNLSKNDLLVSFVAYCINPNHYHFLIRQDKESGVSRFMHRFGVGYTNYFNEKYKRSGSLFQGSFKARHVSNNEDLLRISAYVNLNYKVHRLPLGNSVPKSSWQEYMRPSNKRKERICDTGMILDQFNRKRDYEQFATSSVKSIIAKRRPDIEDLLLE